MDDFIFEYTNENIEEIVNNKFEYYKSNIRSLQIFFGEKRMGWKKYPLVDGKDGTYFHLITKDYQNKDGYCCPNMIIKCDRNFNYNPMMSDEYPDDKKRTICGHRIQCLYLIPYIFQDSNVLIWSREESTPKGLRIRIKLLDEENKYIIILDKRKDGTILYWTSYPIDEKKINRFKKEYEQNKNNIETITVKK